MNTLDLLIDAKELIADRESWCQHAVAIDDYGTPCAISGQKPVAFCAIGALRHVAFTDEDDLNEMARQSRRGHYEQAKACLKMAMATGSITAWNDTHTHHDVIDAFEKAIARRKAVTS